MYFIKNPNENMVFDNDEDRKIEFLLVKYIFFIIMKYK